MTRRKRRLPLYGAAALAALLVGLGVKSMLFPSRPPQRFITAPVTRGDIEQTVQATGEVQPFELVNVGAQVSGRVVSLKVGLGDHVAKGEVIAAIDSTPQVMALKNAEAVLAQMQAQKASQEATLNQARIAFDRQKITRAADASSQADFDTAEATWKTAQANLAATNAQIAQAKVSVQTAQVNLGYTNIVAPISGEVVAVVTKQGQTVNSVQAAPTIVMLANMDKMTVKAQISEADVIKVKPGTPVYFTILGDPNHRYFASLRSVAPAPESVVNDTNTTATSTSSNSTQAIYYDGLFDVVNADRVLRADMTAQVSLVTGAVKNVLSVPSTALADVMPAPPGGGPPKTSGKAGPAANVHPGLVQVLDAKGKPVERKVLVGLDNHIRAEIVSGLKAGERVVLGEAAAASPGARRGPPPPPGG